MSEFECEPCCADDEDGPRKKPKTGWLERWGTTAAHENEADKIDETDETDETDGTDGTDGTDAMGEYGVVSEGEAEATAEELVDALATFDWCKRRGARQDARAATKRQLNAAESYPCLYQGCTRAFDKSSKLERHNAVHRVGETFTCPEPGCAMAFGRPAQLYHHKSERHKPKVLRCDIPGCDAAFGRPGELAFHRRQHTRPYKCDYPHCAYASAAIRHLVAHEHTHTDEKPFACTYPGCSRAFRQSKNRKRHERTRARTPAATRRSPIRWACTDTSTGSKARSVHVSDRTRGGWSSSGVCKTGRFLDIRPPSTRPPRTRLTCRLRHRAEGATKAGARGARGDRGASSTSRARAPRSGSRGWPRRPRRPCG
jgi:hypothetical protein